LGVLQLLEVAAEDHGLLARLLYLLAEDLGQSVGLVRLPRGLVGGRLPHLQHLVHDELLQPLVAVGLAHS
jgi:hypothetical protein